MNKQTEFLIDHEQIPREKNTVLIKNLSTDWNSYQIIKIERFDNSDDTHNSGWLVTYME